ncbi:MAG TPA: hypothetical protein VGM56_06710 [Byssovorax sp.]|jgi:hypothetical protein
MALPKKVKLTLILAPIGLVLAYALLQTAEYFYFRGYSTGERSGIVRKLSIKGSPVCKYFSGELLLQGLQPGLQSDVFEFSVDDDKETNPIVKALHDAERSGNRVTLHYRQDLHSMYRCTPSEYFITSVDK